jgi:hypothetical protein
MAPIYIISPDADLLRFGMLAGRVNWFLIHAFFPHSGQNLGFLSSNDAQHFEHLGHSRFLRFIGFLP